MRAKRGFCPFRDQLGKETGISKERVRQHEVGLKVAITYTAVYIYLPERKQMPVQELELIAAFARTALNDVPASGRHRTNQATQIKTAKLTALVDGRVSDEPSR